MRVIVPGASGFIGKNLILKAPKTWEIVAMYNQSHEFPGFVKEHSLGNVSTVKCDLTSTDEVAEVATHVGNDFDVCVYLAANGNPAVSIEDPILDLSFSTVTVLNFLKVFQVRRFVYFSSGAVYDGLKELVSPAVKVEPGLPYAISHLASEHYARSFTYYTNSIQEYVVLRFFGAYGPHEPKRKIYTKLVKAFNFEDANEFTVRGDGRNYIDAMYIDDAIKGVLQIIVSDKANVTVDFCSGAPLTINELVKQAGAVFGKEHIVIQHVGAVPEYIEFYASDISMKQLFGFEASVTLEAGLRSLADFLTVEGDNALFIH